jgi:hypothetical protein
MITPSSQGVIQRRKVRGGGINNAKERWSVFQSNGGSEAGKRGPQVLPKLSNKVYSVSRATRRECGAPARFRQEALDFVEE